MVTDSRLIVDRTAIERECPDCATAHMPDGDDYYPCPLACRDGVLLREFVVLGDAQLLVPCPEWRHGVEFCRCDFTGFTAAPVGSTWHDVEIAERSIAHDAVRDGLDETVASNAVKQAAANVIAERTAPFAHVRTVHVVDREWMRIRKDDTVKPGQALAYVVNEVRGGPYGFYLPPDQFAALPDGKILYVCDGVTTL
jgi:hypothetical protein